MTATEFVTWLKGFADAANSYNITPKQWDTICEYLQKVKQEVPERHSRYTLDNENWKTSNTSERLDIEYKKNKLETKTLLND